MKLRRKKTEKNLFSRKKKRDNLPFYLKPGRYLIRKLPVSWQIRMRANLRFLMQTQEIRSDSERTVMADQFLYRQSSILFWGIIVSILLLFFVCGMSYFNKTGMILKRNNFGEGERNESLLLQKGRDKQIYNLKIEEVELTGKKQKEYVEAFFSELKKKMKGKNRSLNQVMSALVLEDTLGDYPFLISYETNIDYISPDGTLTALAGSLEGNDSIRTVVHVSADYQNIHEDRNYDITIIPVAVKEKKMTVFDKTMQKIRNLEKKSRRYQMVEIPEKYGDVVVSSGSEQPPAFIGTFLVLVITVFFAARNYNYLKEEKKKCREESLQDFSALVHLFTLYMGAGLSFSSAVKRIVSDYERDKEKKGQRFAYEQTAVLCYQMDTGVSQKEACLNWGRSFEAAIYQKLSLILVQNLSKGTKETRAMMEQMEREAFKERIDHARKKGEEASTKLLFPMIVLLGFVLVIIMFPAMVNFSGF